MTRTSNRTRYLWAIAAVVISCGIVAGAGSTATTARTSNSYVVGAITGLTGQEASFGVSWAQGVTLAASKLKGTGVTVKIADSQSTAAQAVNAAKKLIGVDGAKVIVCGCYSGTFFPVQAYAASKGVLVVNSGSSAPQVRTSKGRTISLLSLDDTVSKELATWAYQRGYRSAAFLVGSDSYSQAVKDNVSATFKKLGGKIVDTTTVQPNQPDYTPEMSAIASAKPDVIFSTTFSNDAKLQFKQGVQLGITSPWYVLYPTVAGLQSFQPAFSHFFGLEIGWLSSAAKPWRAAYLARFKKPVEVPWPALAYDSTMLSGKALLSKASGAAALQQAFVKATKSYLGPSGAITFDKNYTRIDEPFQRLELVSPGKFVPVK